MSKLINLMGQKFGRLIVIKRAGSDSKKGAKWLCRCECGTEKIVRGQDLREGCTKSCGCLQKEIVRKLGKKYKITTGLASIRALKNSYKNSAKRRGYKFNLTEEQFKEITQKDCYYCGAKPNGIQKAQRNNGDYIYNGIDRVDNTKGYTIDNVVPCCKQCNQAKGTLTLQEFKYWIKQIYKKIFETR